MPSYIIMQSLYFLNMLPTIEIVYVDSDPTIFILKTLKKILTAIYCLSLAISALFIKILNCTAFYYTIACKCSVVLC